MYGYDAITGKRLTHLETVKGSKADAVNLLSKRLAERGEGNLVRSNADTVAGYRSRSRKRSGAAAPSRCPQAWCQN